LTSTFISLIDRRLNELIENSDEILPQAMRYSLLSGGKRLRPQLVLAASETLGGTFRDALDPACAIEMIHAFSLIHDDLPCIDNDDIRRGRPTLHRAFSEGIALLAGDALLSEAFLVIAQSNHLSDRQIIRLTTLLAKRVGKEGMTGGQAIDILSEGQTISQDLLVEMDQKKTGDLFACSLEFGAVIANASPSIEEHLHQAGLYLGMAYQIRDDLEDAATAISDKPNENKPTFATLLGTEPTRKFLLQTLEKLNHHLSFLPSGAPMIKRIIDPLFDTKIAP